MPTGYTAPVENGTVTEFRDFALRCARGMGANIMMRDDDMDAPIREYEPSTYLRDWLEEAKKRLERAEKMPLAAAADLAQLEYNRAAESHRRAVEEGAKVRRRYESMIDKVVAWEPPTPDHQGLKDFMLSQLRESLRFDCSHVFEEPTLLTAEEYIAKEIECAQRDIAYHEESWASEQQRVRENNEWNRALVESLKKER